eukprot:Colp12_sorted_trinity150504_noHs@1923
MLPLCLYTGSTTRTKSRSFLEPMLSLQSSMTRRHAPTTSMSSEKNSPYGDQAFATLRILSEMNGDFEVHQFTDKFFAFSKNYSGRQDHATKEFVTHYEAGMRYPMCGADDSQANMIMKVVVVTARYAGHPDLMQKVEEATRCHQNNDVAVRFGRLAASILERVILGAKVSDAVLAVFATATSEDREEMHKAIALKETPHNEAVPILGISCVLPGSFLSNMHGLITGKDYRSAVRATILAGGDNCPRAAFMGACFAAEEAGVPEDWVRRAAAGEECRALATALAEKNV